MMVCVHAVVLAFLATVIMTVMVDGTSDKAVTCIDADGTPVDWYIVYKLPKDKHSSIPQVREGYAQMYMDVNNPVLKLSDVWLNDTNHAIANTLQQIYKNSKELAYLMYNDELPDSLHKSEYYGHTKGDLAFDETSGFWLVHSTPRFPSNTSMRYNWPDSARTYGQSFLCVTYGHDQFEDIGKQLMYNHPWVYDSNLPPRLVSDTPSIVDAAQKKHVTCAPWNRTVFLTSVGGQRFVSFAKASRFGKDLYAAWLAPYFHSDLYAETWQNGPNNLNSSCVKGQTVNNIKTLNLIGGEAFKETKDHSKWAVTPDEGMDWTCIGDINRQCHQMYRGGGTVCFENADVNKVFVDAVTGIHQCPEETHCYQSSFWTGF